MEHLHAWWHGFAGAIRSEDDDSIKTWTFHARSAAIVFKDLSKENANWSAMEDRESTRTDYDNLRCTPLLRLVHFMAFKTCEDSYNH